MIDEPFGLAGRTALVTGASRGIGAAIAIGLARAGAIVHGTARTREALADTARAVAEFGEHQFVAVPAELGSRAGVDSLLRRLESTTVDVVVTGAGSLRRGAASDYSDDAWDEMISMHLDAPFRIARELGRRMVERGQGRVIMIGSMQSFQGGMGLVGYAAAKSGLLGIVRAFANEWAGSGVNVNAIAPGYIETAMTSMRHGDPDARAATESRIPAGRWGRPEDLAGAAVFLAAPASEYVHGVVLPVDGGWLVR